MSEPVDRRANEVDTIAQQSDGRRRRGSHNEGMNGDMNGQRMSSVFSDEASTRATKMKKRFGSVLKYEMADDYDSSGDIERYLPHWLHWQQEDSLREEFTSGLEWSSNR